MDDEENVSRHQCPDDYLARRRQYFLPAAEIVQLGMEHKYELLVSALSFATASFIMGAHHKLSNEIIQKMPMI